MRKLILLLFLIASCNTNDVKIIADSDFDNDGKVFLVQYKENRPVLKDSTYIVNGKFSFLDTISYPEMHYLFFKDIIGNIPFILEPGEIKLNIYKDSLSSSKVSGTKSNDDFKRYKNETLVYTNELSKIDEEINVALSSSDSLLVSDLESQFVNIREKLTDYEFDFINQNNDSYISSLILRRMIFERSIDYNLADSLLNNFSDLIKRTSSSIEIKKIIDNYKLTNSESPRIGSFAPKFSGPGLNGETISLNSIDSKYILLEFWASWCAPCRVSNPGLAETMAKYDQTDFVIVGVSLDNNEASWKKAIEEDGIENWIHISSLKYFNDPISKLYNVASEGVPTSFLIDPERKIIAKNLYSDELEFVLNASLNNN